MQGLDKVTMYTWQHIVWWTNKHQLWLHKHTVKLKTGEKKVTVMDIVGLWRFQTSSSDLDSDKHLGNSSPLLYMCVYVCVCVIVPMLCLQTHKALGSVVHDTQLKALLVLESLGQSAPQCIWRQHTLTAELELSKDTLHTHTHTQGEKSISSFLHCYTLPWMLFLHCLSWVSQNASIPSCIYLLCVCVFISAKLSKHICPVNRHLVPSTDP